MPYPGPEGTGRASTFPLEPPSSSRDFPAIHPLTTPAPPFVSEPVTPVSPLTRRIPDRKGDPFGRDKAVERSLRATPAPLLASIMAVRRTAVEPKASETPPWF